MELNLKCHFNWWMFCIWRFVLWWPQTWVAGAAVRCTTVQHWWNDGHANTSSSTTVSVFWL